MELTAGAGKPIEGGKGAGQLVNDQVATCKDFLQVQKDCELEEKSVAEEFSVTASDGNNTAPSITTLMPYNWVKL